MFVRTSQFLELQVGFERLFLKLMSQFSKKVVGNLTGMHSKRSKECEIPKNIDILIIRYIDIRRMYLLYVSNVSIHSWVCALSKQYLWICPCYLISHYVFQSELSKYKKRDGPWWRNLVQVWCVSMNIIMIYILLLHK